MKRVEFIIASIIASNALSFKIAMANVGLALAVVASQNEFGIGEDPTIRIIVKNDGLTSTFFHNVYAWELIDIEIRNETSGSVIKGDRPPSPPSSHAAMVTNELKAGSQIVLHGLTVNGQPQTWLPLSRWGYKFKKPGAVSLQLSAGQRLVDDLERLSQGNEAMSSSRTLVSPSVLSLTIN